MMQWISPILKDGAGTGNLYKLFNDGSDRHYSDVETGISPLIGILLQSSIMNGRASTDKFHAKAMERVWCC
jgi:hypothetical protein